MSPADHPSAADSWTMNEALKQELASSYPITRNHVESFRENGYIKLPAVLSAAVIGHFKPLVENFALEHQLQQPVLSDRETYGKAFLQVTNLWERDDRLHGLCLAPRLGQIAADLMQVQGVRMYHDQALCKEPGGGFTPWHADQHYWPLSNDNTVTAWIPLQDVPMEMGPLSFCQGSHRLLQHRDLSISDESERRIGRTLKDFPVDESPYHLGDVSFHRGWVFHRAGPNRTDRMRGVMTVIMMEDGIRVIESRRPGDDHERNRFMPGCAPGARAASHLNPVIFRHPD